MEKVDLKIDHTKYSGEPVTCKKHIGMYSCECSICLEGCCGFREGRIHSLEAQVKGANDVAERNMKLRIEAEQSMFALEDEKSKLTADLDFYVKESNALTEKLKNRLPMCPICGKEVALICPDDLEAKCEQIKDLTAQLESDQEVIAQMAADNVKMAKQMDELSAQNARLRSALERIKDGDVGQGGFDPVYSKFAREALQQLSNQGDGK